MCLTADESLMLVLDVDNLRGFVYFAVPSANKNLMLVLDAVYFNVSRIVLFHVPTIMKRL